MGTTPKQKSFSRNLHMLVNNSSTRKIVFCYCGVEAPGHGKDSVDDLKTNEKSFIKMFMTTVQLPVEATEDSQMFMHTAMINTYISLAREFQMFSDQTLEHGFIDPEEDTKQSSKRKWMEHEYHFRDRKYVQHKSVKM